MARVAVLASGGIDSSILLADLAKTDDAFPLYVKAGLVWENQELQVLKQFISRVNNPNIHPVITILSDVNSLYGNHWSITGDRVPKSGTPTSNLFLPGRNILLLSLGALWCGTRNVSRLAIGTLLGNPFPDASQEFFDDFSKTVSKGLAYPVSIEAPYLNLKKEDIIESHRDLPLELTLTCMAPNRSMHCGLCNKCEERKGAFAQSRVIDKTRYADMKEQV